MDRAEKWFYIKFGAFRPGIIIGVNNDKIDYFFVYGVFLLYNFSQPEYLDSDNGSSNIALDVHITINCLFGENHKFPIYDHEREDEDTELHFILAAAFYKSKFVVEELKKLPKSVTETINKKIDRNMSIILTKVFYEGLCSL